MHSLQFRVEIKVEARDAQLGCTKLYRAGCKIWRFLAIVVSLPRDKLIWEFGSGFFINADFFAMPSLSICLVGVVCGFWIPPRPFGLLISD